METSIYNSSAKLKAILDAHGLHMQKKFGQNFLIDENIRNKLVDILNLDSKKTVWEIGPGLGSMTSLLLQTGAEVVAFEIDRGFIKILYEIFNNYKNFKLVEGDVLKTWQREVLIKKPDVFFGNLPYNIAATLILDTIEKGVIFDDCLVTVQKEVADRFCASVGGDYSATSVLVQAFYETTSIQTIGASCFFPQPNVLSKAIRLTKTEKYTSQIAGREKLFFSLVKGLFAARRKTLKNNLQVWLKKNLKEKSYTIDVPELIDKILSLEMQRRRAETLAVQDFVDISKKVAKSFQDCE
ncbi:MAG: 16S rRNA (adenine(1518)-N(6)/adenine(1519)-N(6))-dimethyltransferase RsmA [Treponemataceae bacterium]